MDNKNIVELLLQLLKNEDNQNYKSDDFGSEIKIVVLQRGWVVIGRYQQQGEYSLLTDAYIIRRWGTSEGLGELALKGRQSETKLEKTGVIRFHKLTTVQLIDCDDKIWNKEL